MHGFTSFPTIFMFWLSLPIVFGLEYWEYFQPVSNIFHIVLQVVILGIILKWAWFWNQRLMNIEIEKVNQLMSESHDFVEIKSGK
jgi:hypothetical protein